MASREEKLFACFPAVSTKEWEEKIYVDLKGKDYEKTLVWDTYEGFKVNPYYRRENLDGIGYLDSMPGQHPYVRGTKSRGNNWLIRQSILVSDLSAANKKALDILGKGVNSLGFIFEKRDGITAGDLKILLKNIPLEEIEINFESIGLKYNFANPFVDYLNNTAAGNSKISGSAGMDPLGSYVLHGRIDGDIYSELKQAIDVSAELPFFRIISVNGRFFANSGGSLVHELAFSLAQGAEYLVKLTEAGLGIDEAAANIKFNFGIGSNYFMEIAKLRAARLLWAGIVREFNCTNEDSAKMIIHSETNSINKTFYEPWVNMIRTQTETMSAVLGSADSVTVRPFNAVFENPSGFSERIARNQQILLKEESHLDKVADPAGGSYYIENLTASLSDSSWNLFLEVMGRGGFTEAFRQGLIQDKIKSLVSGRNKNIVFRRENILGTNQYPNFTERKDKIFDDSLFCPVDLSEEGADTETLKLFRTAQPLEILRYRTDIYSLKNRRPVVFMLPLGNPALRRARAQFSCNFFAVAGFEIIDNNGFSSAEQGVAAAAEVNADIVVVCSSDEEYQELVPKVAGMLKNEILVVAGNPECRPFLEEKGIVNYIHLKSNIQEELKKYQHLLFKE
jgi:methylmalonyl-CoA mutase